MPVMYHKIPEEHAGQRLDNFMFWYMKGIPKSRLQRAIRKGEVKVNRSRSLPSYKLLENDEVRIPPLYADKSSDNKKITTPKCQDIPIIFENNHLLVVDKPYSLAVHGGSGINHGVIETIRHMRRDLKYIELVHRLDRETSGVLLLAKKKMVLRELHEQFREKTVEKIYFALVHGNPEGDFFVSNQPLLKNILKSGERIVEVDSLGQKSCTEFEVLEKYPAHNLSLVKARPLTGRTHQIRVHLADLGLPIVGDCKYGKINSRTMHKDLKKRLFLHANKLKLKVLNQDMVFESVLDSRFEKVLNLAKRDELCLVKTKT